MPSKSVPVPVLLGLVLCGAKRLLADCSVADDNVKRVPIKIKVGPKKDHKQQRYLLHVITSIATDDDCLLGHLP